MTNVGFEPTPFQTSALNWRLRPLGQLITLYWTTFLAIIYVKFTRGAITI